MSRDLGWEYFEKLAKQRIMQVQSASDPPKKLALGERAVMADGIEYVVLQPKECGQAGRAGLCRREGTPLIIGPNAIFKNAPNPNAARLFQSFSFSPECQQLIIDAGGMRSAHRADQGEARPHAVHGHQADEGRRRGGREDERGDQGALHQDVQGVSERSEGLCCRERRCAPLPLRGRVGGGGSKLVAPFVRKLLTPSLAPSRKGEGTG